VPKTQTAAERKNARELAVYHDKLDRGVCVQVGCTRKARPGSSRCRTCRLWVNDRTKKAKRKARKGKTRADRPY
jgi:hypothetical protein